jgi:hypothetical protein
VYQLTIESTKHNYEVGDTGPGGGIIFYVNESGFTEIGSNCGSSCHYLEFAPGNWNINPATDIESGVVWSTDTTNSVMTNDSTVDDGSGNQAIGYGFQNTQFMAVSDTAGAAFRAINYYGTDINTLGEWFVPSQMELIEMFNSPAFAGNGFGNGRYWSSSEYDSGRAWIWNPQRFPNYEPRTKNNGHYLRIIRAG